MTPVEAPVSDLTARAKQVAAIAEKFAGEGSGE